MSTSRMNKSTPVTRLDGTATGVGGGQIRIPLKKESLIAEHKIRVQASQAYTGVPTSSDVRRFITNAAIETSNGRRIFLTGFQVYDLGRFTENAPISNVVLAATSTADFDFDIHHENDEALLDMLAAIPAGKLTTFDLVLDMAPDASNGFLGGTVPLVTTYTVTARSYGFPGMLNGMRADGLEHGESDFVGSLRHMAERVLQPGTAGAGTTYDLRLIAGNKARFLMVHAFDTTVVGIQTPSDAVLSDMRLVVNGQEISISTFAELRKENAHIRGFNVLGCAVIDFGDDENGWLDLRNVNEPKLTVTIATGAPASYLITLAQDYSVFMNK